MTQKRIVLAIIVIAVFAALAAGLYTDRLISDGIATIFKADKNDIVKIEYASENENYFISKENNKWLIGGLDEKPVDEKKMDILLTVSENIFVNEAPKGEYETGIDSSQNSMTYYLKNGETKTITFGNYDVSMSNIYVRVDSKRNVYKMNVKTYKSLFLPQADIERHLLHYFPAENIERLKISVYNTDFEIFRTLNGEKWEFKTPELGECSENNVMKKLISPCANVSAVDMVKTQNLEAYGLKKPQGFYEITANGEKTKVLIGNTEAGTTYVMLSEGDVVFKIDSTSLDFLKTNAVEIVNKAVITSDAENISGFTVKYEDIELTVDAKANTINGVAVTEKEIEAEISLLLGLEFSNFYRGENKFKTIYSLTVAFNDGSVSEYNFNYGTNGNYILTLKNGKSVTLPKSGVDAAFTSLRKFFKNS